MPDQAFPASQGSLAGHREREQFRADMVAAVGEEWQFLCLPASDDTTTWTDLSRNAETITLGQSFQLFATTPRTKGYGMDVKVDGSIRETASIADANAYSFGDGSADYPFSVAMLIKPSAADIANGATLISKYPAGPTAAREWIVDITSDGYPRIRTYDESADAIVGREDQTALTGNWALLVFSYDGRGAVAGFDIYLDGAEVDSDNVSSGSYTAMENGAGKVYIGSTIQTSGAQISRFSGSYGFIGLIPKDLHPDEVFAMKGVVNAYFKESL